MRRCQWRTVLALALLGVVLAPPAPAASRKVGVLVVYAPSDTASEKVAVAIKERLKMLRTDAAYSNEQFPYVMYYFDRPDEQRHCQMLKIGAKDLPFVGVVSLNSAGDPVDVLVRFPRAQDEGTADTAFTKAQTLLGLVPKSALGLFVAGQADALKVSVLQDVKGTMTPVDAGKSFHSGDQIKVALESNFTGYVYVVNVTPGGQSRVMFPHPNAPDNRVHPGVRYELPPGNNRMEFDQEAGTETLLVYLSRNPISQIDDVIKKGGTVALSPSVPQSMEGGIKVASAHQEFEAGGQSRGLVMTQATTGETYVSVTPVSTGGKLGSGQTAVFELHLHHI